MLASSSLAQAGAPGDRLRASAMTATESDAFMAFITHSSAAVLAGRMHPFVFSEAGQVQCRLGTGEANLVLSCFEAVASRLSTVPVRKQVCFLAIPEHRIVEDHKARSEPGGKEMEERL